MHQVYGRCHGMKTNVDVHSMAKLPAFRSHEQSAGRVAKRRRVEATGRLEADQKYKPDWAGDDMLSKVVNAAINFKPLYKLMKIMAKQVVIQTANKKGLRWQETVEELAGIQEIYDIKDEIEDESIVYPDYYLQAFHAYDKGNLEWSAAFEAELATLAIGTRTWKNENLTAHQAQDKLRACIFDTLQAFTSQHSIKQPKHILDLGCSVGVSTRYLADQFPDARVTGLDLSPHFISVAEYKEREQERAGELDHRRRIRYRHGLGEATKLPSEWFDLVQIGFVIHECRPFAIEDLAKEAYRLLQKGGCLFMFDNNPRSKTIQNLPPALFTLMKSTEPWSDEYYMMDVEDSLRKIGFSQVETRVIDHRHRAIFGIKP